MAGWYFGLAPTRTDALGVWGGGLALALLLGLLASFAPPGAAVVAAVAVLVLAAYYVRVLGRGAGLVVLLIVASVVDHFTFSVGPLALRAEQVAALIAVCVLVFLKMREGETSWLKP